MDCLSRLMGLPSSFGLMWLWHVLRSGCMVKECELRGSVFLIALCPRRLRCSCASIFPDSICSSPISLSSTDLVDMVLSDESLPAEKIRRNSHGSCMSRCADLETYTAQSQGTST